MISLACSLISVDLYCLVHCCIEPTPRMETPAPTNEPTKRPRPEPTPRPTPDEPDDDSRNDDTPKPSPRPTKSTPDPTRHQTPKPSDEPTKRPRPEPTPSPTPQPQKQKETPSPTHEPPTEHPTMDDNVDEDSDEIDFVGQCYFNKCRKCQGDCDNDHECGEGLICYQRKGNDQKIPGCSRGSPIGDVDYCIRKGDMDETPKPTNEPSIFMADEPTPHPTAHHVAQPSSEIGDHSNVLREVAKPGNDDDNKLGRCQGDCSSNDDCIGDLKCYKRKNFAPGGNVEDSNRFRGVLATESGSMTIATIPQMLGRRHVQRGSQPHGRQRCPLEASN